MFADYLRALHDSLLPAGFQVVVLSSRYSADEEEKAIAKKSATLVSKLEAYLPPEEVERIQDAYDFAFEAHQGQRRRSGEPYITHPVAVADLLADLKLDPQTLIAAILHDVIEDTPTLKEEINRRFGQEVAELVDAVSKLDQIQFKSREEAHALVLAGQVYLGEVKAEKAGQFVTEETPLIVRGDTCPFVSRGGYKLLKAIDTFSISLEGKVCADIGASTGGKRSNGGGSWRISARSTAASTSSSTMPASRASSTAAGRTIRSTRCSRSRNSTSMAYRMPQVWMPPHGSSHSASPSASGARASRPNPHWRTPRGRSSTRATVRPVRRQRTGIAATP